MIGLVPAALLVTFVTDCSAAAAGRGTGGRRRASTVAAGRGGGVWGRRGLPDHLEQVVLAESDGDGVTLVIEVSGDPAALAAALPLLAHEGTTLVNSWTARDRHLALGRPVPPAAPHHP